MGEKEKLVELEQQGAFWGNLFVSQGLHPNRLKKCLFNREGLPQLLCNNNQNTTPLQVEDLIFCSERGCIFSFPDSKLACVFACKFYTILVRMWHASIQILKKYSPSFKRIHGLAFGFVWLRPGETGTLQ